MWSTVCRPSPHSHPGSSTSGTLLKTSRRVVASYMGSSDLLAMRARQLENRATDSEELTLRKRRFREQGKDRFDMDKNAVDKEFRPKDIVLHHDPQSRIDKSSKRKLAYRWKGPFRISKAAPEKGYYYLEDMDGTPYRSTFAGVRLKRFIFRSGLAVPDDNVPEPENDQSPPPSFLPNPPFKDMFPDPSHRASR